MPRFAPSAVRPTEAAWAGGYGGGPHYIERARQRSRAQTALRAAGGGPGGGARTVADVEDLFDETGLPTRLPRNKQEAMLFQLQASRSARQLQARQTAAALSSVRYGLGLTQFQSPYGLGALMSPLLGQMAGIQERVQYAPSDFSYFIRPDAYGAVGAGYGGAARGPVVGQGRQVPRTMGMGFQPEPVLARPVPSHARPALPIPTVQNLAIPAIADEPYLDMDVLSEMGGFIGEEAAEAMQVPTPGPQQPAGEWWRP